jgi:hypothetical protein
MIMKKTMGVLTLIAGISLIGLACEATQIQTPNASNNLRWEACRRSCHSKQCMDMGPNKRKICMQCCHTKHKHPGPLMNECQRHCPK